MENITHTKEERPDNSRLVLIEKKSKFGGIYYTYNDLDSVDEDTVSWWYAGDLIALVKSLGK